MRANVLDEPSLEFAAGARHPDPRFGIAEYGPADLTAASAPRSISVGLLGGRSDIEQAGSWLEGCRTPIAGKKSDRPGLHPSFPGFGPQAGYCSELILDSRLQRTVSAKELAELARLDPRARVQVAVDLYLEELTGLVQDGRPDVVICHIPDELLGLDAEPEVGEPQDVVDSETAEGAQPVAFHDLLKARAMSLRVPLQLLRGSTYDPKRAARQKRKTWKR